MAKKKVNTKPKPSVRIIAGQPIDKKGKSQRSKKKS